MNDFQTFTTAVILFENNDMIRNYMRNIYNTIKHFHMKHRKPLPAFDQPITNKLCIDHDIYDNIEMTKYCMNIGHSDKQEEILKINNYLLCHFATNVGDYKSKLDRINFTLNYIVHSCFDDSC